MSPTTIPGNLLLKNGMVITGREADPLLLDSYSGAAAAYSLRQLSWAYGGPVVRVRRDNNNAEQDFTATEVSDGTLAAWVGAGNDGFVRNWYDQSGNNRNAGQGTNARQPRLVINGAVVTANGTPSIDFNAATNNYLTANSVATAFASANRPLSSFCVYRHDRVNVSEEVYAFGKNGSGIADYLVVRNNTTGQYRIAGNGSGTTVSLLGGTVSAQTQVLRTEVLLSITASTYINGSVIAGIDNAAFNVPNVAFDEFDIGNWNEGGYVTPVDGRFAELILYPSNQSTNRTAIEANINAYYSIYP